MGNYQAALRGLNQAQRTAVTTTEGPILVIAGPGTGKTQLLTTRIAHILSTTDALPENVLCLTFTESAANNMRERLSSMIGQAAFKITISTYHAFGSDLIRRFADYFTDGGDLEPIDDLGIDEIFRNIINELPYSSPLRFADSYLNDVKSFVSDAKRALLQPDDIRAVATSNQTFLDRIQPVIHDALDGLTRMNDASAEERFQKLADNILASDEPSEQNIMPLSRLFTASLSEALAQVADTGKKNALTKWKDDWLAKDIAGNFIADGAKTNQKLMTLADIYEQYVKRLAETHLFDYDDMILRAVRGLESNDDLRFTLQEQYQYILLDEFQDTNGAQLQLIELLTDNPVHEGRPNVLAVGDDDQAIYAFQGADYSHMLQFQRLYNNVLLVPLTQNYRSHADVLHLARGIAEQIEERLHHHFPDIEKSLVASNPNMPAHGKVERHEAASETAQFAWAAQRIKALMQSGTPAHEIAVLAPQHKYLEPMVAYLQELDIPVHYDKRENILDDPAISQLIRMSELVLALHNKQLVQSNTLWSEVLSFNFWQLPTSLIWHVSWQASDDDQDWTETLLQNDQLRPIALFFMRLSMVAATETLETMLDILIGTLSLELQEPGQAIYTSPFYTYYFEKQADPSTSGDLEHVGAYWNVLSNLTVLRSRLREYRRGSDDPLKLNDFLAFATAHRAANIKILNTSPYQNGEDAVQLMTAFKAKGMEFEAVFVLAVMDEAWGTSARGQVNHLSLPPNLHYMRYGRATSDERLRLFYVAVTRAKTTLYLLNYRQNFSGKNLSRLQYLDETVEGDAVHSPLLPDGNQAVLDIAHTGNDQQKQSLELATYWHSRHVQTWSDENVQALLHSRLEQFQLSPTHVNAFIDLEHGGPQHFFMNTILRFPQAIGANGQFGNAMHETLEWLHIQNKQHSAIPDIAASLQFFGRRLALKKLSTHDTGRLLERGEIALRAYLVQRDHTINKVNMCERNFRNDGIFIGSAHMAGKIDKLLIDTDAKTITIVDYKTGRSHNRWDKSVKLHKYRQQLYLYKALVENTRIFADYVVTDAYLEFVEPDDNGIIQELHLAFDPDEYSNVQALAERVWQHLQALNIPDVSTYTPDMKGVTEFEADLLSQ